MISPLSSADMNFTNSLSPINMINQFNSFQQCNNSINNVDDIDLFQYLDIVQNIPYDHDLTRYVDIHGPQWIQNVVEYFIGI